jgi:3-oxoadipate enol-lactonase
MPFFQSQGRNIYYERHGQGQPVLFLHGAGSNAATWWQQLAALSPWYTCYTMDARCFGRSAAPLSEFDIHIFAADVLAFQKMLGFERMALVGQSLGGMIATRFAAEHPERVSALVLCDSPMGIDHAGQQTILRERLQKVAGLTIEQRSLGAWFIANRPDLVALYGQINHFNPAFYLEQGVEWQKAMAHLNEPDQLLSLDRLRDIPCPCLIVVGEDDPIVPVSIMREVQALLPHCALQVIPQAAHSAYFEQAELVNGHLLRFLKTHLVDLA